MSTGIKATIWVVVAVVVIGGGVWWWMSMTQSTNAPSAYQNNPAPTSASTANSGTSSSGSSGSGSISATDTSDAALQSDLSVVDSQTNNFSSDNNNVNQGMSDQETQQSSL
jgi:cytoskeletal protein RodZ